MNLFVFHVCGVVVGFCATSAALHAWVFSTTKSPVTFLAIAVLAVSFRQIAYHKVLGSVLAEIVSRPRQEKPEGSIKCQLT